MCGIGTGKLQSAGESLSSSSAQTLLGIVEPNSTAPPAAAALPKKLRRDKRARNWEAGEVLFIRLSSFIFLIHFFLRFVNAQKGLYRRRAAQAVQLGGTLKLAGPRESQYFC